MLKILYLGERNRRIINYLSKYSNITVKTDPLNLNIINEDFDWIISYGYRHIISENIIKFYKKRIINLHISYLPWNRGAHPNFWSFIDDTPKGVTIHEIDFGIDTGPILCQKEIFFNDENETLATTYEKLSLEIETLFIENWPKIMQNKITPKKNNYKQFGSYHRSSDIEKYFESLSKKWNSEIKEVVSMKGNQINLGQFSIGKNSKPFIIAEMSGNHNQSLERALEIVEAAAKSGAHALKIQTYTADTLTLNVESDDFLIKDDESLWKGRKLHDLYNEAYTPWEWHEPIFNRAKELGMLAFSTPFDDSAVDFLETLDVPLYKIASFENTDLPLIKKVAATGKPMIVSTGMANAGELDELVRTAKENGCKDLILLKCTSTYPATPENTNIATIPHMRELFDVQVGLSDHTMGTGVAVAAVALGATVIEKHFTLSRADGGVDAAFSMEPAEMKALVEETERAWQAIGKVTYGPTEKEKASLKFRRSIYVAKDIQAGESFTEENIRIVRPGYGLEPKYYPNLIGKVAKKSYTMGTPITFDDLI